MSEAVWLASVQMIEEWESEIGEPPTALAFDLFRLFSQGR